MFFNFALFKSVKSKPSPFLTYAEVAKVLNITRYRVTRLESLGWLTPVTRPGLKYTFFRREQVNEAKLKLEQSGGGARE